jgi:iron complex outermembrane receptor protein
MRPRLLPLLIAQSFCLPAFAQSSSPATAHDEEHEFEAIVVEADPLRGPLGEVAQPITVLRGETLEARKAATLGDTLAMTPGVQSASFGPGVGRPVIRGLDGARVQVLADSLPSQDVSTVSGDHATTIEPFLAEQIEVLRGPATLLHGAGAVGGVVNVIDGRIAERAAEEPFSGRAQLGYDSVSEGRFGMAKVELGGEGFVLRADAFHRDADDYEIPGKAAREADHDGDHAGAEGILENSSLRTRGGAIGASLVADGGFLGLALSTFKSNYGLPGHAHEHADAGALKDGEEEIVRLDLEQTRIEWKGGLDKPWGGAEQLRLRLARTDYEHVELEGDQVGTRFENQEWASRIDVIHEEIAGWRGAYGLSFGQRDFSAAGEEAFVPPSDTTQWGLFVVERKRFDAWRVELGARYDHQQIDPAAGRARDHDGFSLSVAGIRELAAGVEASIGFDRAARAPTAEELYSDGPHAATQSFEIGDDSLNTEIANQIEIGLRTRGERFSGGAHVYYNRFQDFIFLADTGLEQDGLPVRQWTQADARFTGFELEGILHLAETAIGHIDLYGFADHVRGRLTGDGGDLPRIPQDRIGAELRWHQGPWRASFGGTHYFKQDRTAEFETATDSYTLWNTQLSYALALDGADLEFYLKGENLGDAEARPHTSLLKDRAPLPGRNMGAGVRLYF